MITSLNPAIKKPDQGLTDFQTDINTAAYATLDIEQLISHTRPALVDTIILYRALMEE